MMTVGVQITGEASSSFMGVYSKWAAGRNQPVFFDTAHIYQGTTTEMGEVFKADPSMCASGTVITKVSPWDAEWNYLVGGLSRENIRAQIEEELSRAGMSCFELVYLHSPDPTTDLLESVGALVELIAEGKIKSWGLSNFPAWQTAYISEAALRREWPVPAVYQGKYNAFTRNMEVELFPCLQHYGIAFHGFNPLMGGVLTGKYKHNTKPTEGRFSGDLHYSAGYMDRYWKKEIFDALDHVQKSIEAHDDCTDLAEASLRWLVHHSVLAGSASDLKLPHGVIIGASSNRTLERNMTAFDKGPLPAAVAESFEEAYSVAKPVEARYCH